MNGAVIVEAVMNIQPVCIDDVCVLRLFVLKGYSRQGKVNPSPFLCSILRPEQLFPDAMRFPVELVNQVLNEVWGDGEGEDSDDMVIGTVLGTHITRTVTICRRKSKVAVA